MSDRPTKLVPLPTDLVDLLDVAAHDRMVGRSRLAELLLRAALAELPPVDSYGRPLPAAPVVLDEHPAARAARCGPNCEHVTDRAGPDPFG